MEVVLYNSTVCRLCGQENDNGTFLYSTEENNQNISDLVNAYLPIKVSDDGKLPRTICPGCTIQLEATVEFINLIVNGQKAIRSLYEREKEYKKNLSKVSANDTDGSIIVEVDPLGANGVYKDEHPISLQVAGLDKPKRKRGRPPKKIKSPEEQALEKVAVEKEVKVKPKDEEPTGKRRRKTPERFKEVVQGKELDQIFKEEGMTDGEESEDEVKLDKPRPLKDTERVLKSPEVIGHTSGSGELVVVVKGKGRGRPKGRTKQTRETCAICGLEFSNAGRYMSHIAQHGPVLYQCQLCALSFATRLDFNRHQQETGHTGLIVLPGKEEEIVVGTEPATQELPPNPLQPPAEIFCPETQDENGGTNVVAGSLPDLNPSPAEVEKIDATEKGTAQNETSENFKISPVDTPKKDKLKCPHCDKRYNSKQAKSLHIKAAHKGERPYICGICGATFAYPRAHALHALAHRAHHAKGFACDLCGKVLNHPSSVAYHKEAVHANQRYVCNKCGKHFKHKQLLQRHQLVHTQNRPFQCKVCNSKFKTKANLLNHQMLHSGVKKFSCEECKQRFAHKTSLTLHMRWHRGQKPFACKFCDKAFTQKGNLSEHLRIHTGEKPFQCALCPRRFTTSSQHRLHIRRHDPKPAPRPQPLKPNELNETTTTLVSEDGSLIHLTINSSAQNIPTIIPAIPAVPAVPPVSAPAPAPAPSGHKCTYCPRVCPTRWALSKHLRLHTGEKPFKCPHCARSFADASNLNKHKRQVHKQTSLLAVQPAFLPPKPLPPLGEALGGHYVVHAEDDERVIYVTYDVDAPEPDYQIMETEQQNEITLDSGDLYSGESLLLESKPSEEPEHMSVTDEQGNPLHFTMQDGTQLAITSLDGQSLQVITQDGQTIPVEINGFGQEGEESPMQESAVHELNLKEEDPGSSVTHYYTIV